MHDSAGYLTPQSCLNSYFRNAGSLSVVRYTAIVPAALIPRGARLTLKQALQTLPLATQTTDGQFTGGLREIAKALGVPLTPALSCRSFPQTMAALRSGRFWSSVPAIAVGEADGSRIHRLGDPLLHALDREAMLAWNPRLIRVRPNAARIASKLQHALQL